MSDLKECGKPAFVKYFWPGQEGRFACVECASGVKGIANVMGFDLAVEFVHSDSEETCYQMVSPNLAAKENNEPAS